MARRSNHKTRTDAERDARRSSDRERIEQAARALLTSEGWRRWIKVGAGNGLSRYSLRNQWLIAIDCHARGITPTYVAGFRAFLDLNRCVRKGEQAIRILAPVAVKQRDEHGHETGEKKLFFRTVPVFDTLSRDRCCGFRGWGSAVEDARQRQRGDRAAARVRSPEGDEPVPPRGARSSPGLEPGRRCEGARAPTFWWPGRLEA